MTRKALRERERAASAIQRTAAEGRTGPRPTVAEGSPALYTSRRAMRETATRAAHALPVQLAAPGGPESPSIRVDAPALGNAGEHTPTTRARRPQPSGGSGAPARSVAIRPSRRPARGRWASTVAKHVTAGGALLLIGSLVVVTSLPAQAVQTPSQLEPDVAQLEPGVQSLDPVAADVTTLFPRDEIVVNDARASALLTAEERSAMQRTADSERGGSYFGGSPAFPETWAQLETAYVQTPFPELAQLPISSGFGYRTGGFHGGTDIPLPPGQEIRPIANGVVSAVWQGNNPGGGGYAVFIDHNIDGQFVQSWYPHMLAGSIQVEVGQVVDISTVVGEVGSTGRSTGPHLHLELKNSDYVSFDPVLWLQTRQMRLETS